MEKCWVMLRSFVYDAYILLGRCVASSTREEMRKQNQHTRQAFIFH